MASLAIFDNLAQLDAALKSVAATSSSVAEQVSGDAARITQAVSDARTAGYEMGEVIEGITEQIGDNTNIWSEELQLQFDLLAVGGQRLDAFLAKWGDAVVQTANGAETIRQAFEGLDARGREQEIQQLIQAVRHGAEGVTEALGFLSKAQGKYADELRKTVEAVLSGKADIGKLLALLNQIKAQFGNTAFADLAQALTDAARQGSLP